MDGYDSLFNVLCQLDAIRQHWQAVCGESEISLVNQNALATRQDLNPFIVEQLGEDDLDIAHMAEESRPGLIAGKG